MSKEVTPPLTLIIVSSIMFIVIIAGGIFISVVKPDSFGAFVTLLAIGGTTVTAYIANFFAQRKTQEAVASVREEVGKVHKQVNGNLSRQVDENERLTDILAVNNIDPTTMTRREYRDQKGH